MAASCREIITVQLGSESNFVGTHWWNIQESSFVYDRKAAEADSTRLNHDVLFREGKNVHNKTTFTPRLVVVDFKDNIGRPALSRNLYPEFATPSDHSNLLGPTTSVTISRPAKPANQFLTDLEAHDNSRDRGLDQSSAIAGTRAEDKLYNLDDAVSTWTDFLKVPFHPKSLLACESLNPNGTMSRFEDGENECKTGLLEAFESHLRFFAEDSNRLQGFHFLCDVHDGMAGLVSEFVQYIRDEYPRTVSFASPIFPCHLELEDSYAISQYVWNAANGLASIGANCTIVLPLSMAGKLWNRPAEQRQLRYLNYKANLPYHTGAIIASALETATTPWRTILGAVTLPSVCDSLDFAGRKFVQLWSSLPLEADLVADVYKRVEGEQMNKVSVPVPLTPYARSSVGSVGHDDTYSPFQRSLQISIRGAKEILKLSNTAGHNHTISDIPIDRIVDWMVVETGGSGPAWPCSILEPVYTKAPYPNIFSKVVGMNGLAVGAPRPSDQGVSSMPTMTAMDSSTQSGRVVKALVEGVGRLNWQKLKIDRDSVDQVLNQLIDLSGPYSVNTSS